MVYTIGIKRRFWFGFKQYSVTGHKTEILGSGSRMNLNLANGGQLAIPAIHRKTVYVYPIPVAQSAQISPPEME